MKYPSAFHKLISIDRGRFIGNNLHISHDSINWIFCEKLIINDEGELFNHHHCLLHSLQSCYVQIYPKLNQIDDLPVVFIKTFDNEKLYIKINSKSDFGSLVSCLIIWQNLKPSGLVKKWYCENKVQFSLISNQSHELLVCRFKIYGPIPKNKIKIVDGPNIPLYVNDEDWGPSPISEINEGWFYTMGVLKSNGIINFITELDGILIYSIDIKNLLASEIRQVHNSVYDSSNMLLLSHIKELRFNNAIKTTNPSNLDNYSMPNFLTRDNRTIPSNERIAIEFPLHIDLEDWYVGLQYFAKREYIGSFSANSKLIENMQRKYSIPLIPDEDDTPRKPNSTSSTPPPLNQFSRDNLRVSKNLHIDIIEAKFDNVNEESKSTGKIYAEVRMWGLPWSRTAIVDHTSNPFWKEEFTTSLPISTQMIHILIKKSLFNGYSYSAGDKLIGTVYVTPDVLTKKVNSSSTIMTESATNNRIHINDTSSTLNNDIFRLPIYDSANIPIGKLLLNANLQEYHILPPSYFKPLEKMLINAPMDELIDYCNESVSSLEFENVSLILLDVFQYLGVEDKWFKALMDKELINVDKLTRKNYVSNKKSERLGLGPSANSSTATSSNNVFNTLFRGLSIFSKSLEKYNLRIGQEYLEKVFGNLFSKIAEDRKNCEVDPRYVRLEEKARRKGKNIDDLDTSSDSDSEAHDSDEEELLNRKIDKIVDENFENLYAYAEEIWRMIYITSNDLPLQIKNQLKNFRTKVELACDPSDKETALNCLSAFLFLRFFCPAILNPKLFYLTKDHQTGKTQRTLTLIAKILLNLANRQRFSSHKEPHLLKMNKFLDSHESEIYEYFDKITGRKNDFNEKILDLSHEVKRLDLGLSGDSASSELPTTPYLIDKYLRLTEFVHFLSRNSNNPINSKIGSPKLPANKNDTFMPENRIMNTDKIETNSRTYAKDNGNSTNTHLKTNGRNLSPIAGDMKVNDDRNVYQIGSLEFEKAEFLDLAGDQETEGFIKSLCRSDENIFSFITSNITLKDLQKQSNTLMNLIHDLENFLELPELPANYLQQTSPNSNLQQNQHQQAHHSNKVNDKPPLLWDSFCNEILRKCYLDLSRNTLLYVEKDIFISQNYRKLLEQNALGLLKLKFAESDENNDVTIHSKQLMSSSFSNTSLSLILKSGSKNPIKRWFSKSSR